MSKFSILIGPDEFDGLKCDLDQQLPTREPEPETDRTRIAKPEDRDVARLVVKTFLGLIVGALVVASGLGIATSDWIALAIVWLVVAAPLGALFDRYIG